MTTANLFRTAQRDPGYIMPIRIPRDNFRYDYFVYNPGEHVLFGGSTQRGKTTLAFGLLEAIVSPALPAYVVQSKPTDKITETESRRLGFRVVSGWPPVTKVQEMKMFGGEPPNGYLIKPHFGDIANDVENASRVTAKVLADRYAAGARGKHGILVLDDTVIKAKVLGLDQNMTTILAMAGAMGLGEWIFTQKSTDAGKTVLWSYSQAEHTFLLKDKDERNRRRYGEISGIDTKYVMWVLSMLRPFEFLYIRNTPEPGQDESPMCIVEAKK